MTVAAEAAFDTRFKRQRQRVDAALAVCLPASPACPEVLHRALAYSVEAGGKRLRPVLTLTCAEAVTSDAATVALAEPAACAIELIHTYSLIHDDLPAMDNDTLRRGRPTSHVVFGDGLAILAGDGLLTEAFVLLARRPEGTDPGLFARKLRTIDIVATAAGACGMAGGQAIDLAAAGQVRMMSGQAVPALDAGSLADMHARKTGALIRASAMAGVVMAGGSDDQIASIASYATDLGLAFQIVDDILDVEGTATDLGKSAGKDAAAGKPTYPAMHGVERSRQLAGEARDRAIAALSATHWAGAEPLIALARWLVARTS